jgi:SAM-dependent methyltransferase
MASGSFYDRPSVAERYRDYERSPSDPVEVMEEPALLEEVGSVAGLDIIDLGCGDAEFGRRALEDSCASYLGIDDSGAMLAGARRMLDGTRAVLRHARIEDFEPVRNSLDLVVSRLALHYVDDVTAVFAACSEGLRVGGRMVFTVLHPLITSNDARGPDELRQSWVVDGYFQQGPKQRRWLEDTVTWYHRPLETWIQEFLDAGFQLTTVSECEPLRDRLPDVAEYERRRRIPLFLLISGRVQ